jgi:hypothetical protein
MNLKDGKQQNIQKQLDFGAAAPELPARFFIPCDLLWDSGGIQLISATPPKMHLQIYSSATTFPVNRLNNN